MKAPGVTRIAVGRTRYVINYLSGNHVLVKEWVEMASRCIKDKDAVILRNVAFAAIQQRLKEILGESPAALILFEAGKGYGRRSIERLASEAKVDGKALLAKVEKLKKAEGWGSISFGKFGLKAKAGLIVVEGSFEALGHGSSTQPVCQFLRGYLSSVVSYVLGEETVLIETKCLAKGDPYCEFTPKTRESLA